MTVTGKRKCIGILLFDGETWAGGYYYIINMLKALKTLDDSYKPEIKIFYFNDSTLPQVREVGYEYISYYPIYYPCSISGRIINKLCRPFIKKDLVSPRPYSKNMIEFILPYNYLSNYYSLKNLDKIYWIPDFQHLYYPNFFSKELLNKRNTCILNISTKNNRLILSSEDAFNDYKKFYPDYKNKIFVTPFVSILPDISKVDWKKLTVKYNITEPYFFSPNQFWRHKNHIAVIKALLVLKNKGISVRVLFSGREDDPRDKDYTIGLKQFVTENSLEDNVKFLGFIDRKEQLTIMQHALAVVQPSLFEGWSTVIEDAKALNQFVIASNLDVHKEQLKNNAAFFDPHNEEMLADILSNYVQNIPPKARNNYERSIKEYAEKVKQVFME